MELSSNVRMQEPYKIPEDGGVQAGNGGRRWFALITMPRHEKVVAKGLRSSGVEAFLPLYRSRRRWSDRVKEVELPLFAGYVFARFEPAGRVGILRTPGVRAIVSFGKFPTPVPDHEIVALQNMVASGLPLEPWPFLRVGERVRLEGGPLDGLEGILVRVDRVWRVVVSVNLLQRSVAAEVDRCWVRPLGRVARAAG